MFVDILPSLPPSLPGFPIRVKLCLHTDCSAEWGDNESVEESVTNIDTAAAGEAGSPLLSSQHRQRWQDWAVVQQTAIAGVCNTRHDIDMQ